MRRCILLSIFLLLLLASSGQSSNLIFKHLNRESGLPVDVVTCLAQDSTGFIWIGSSEGLFRFDGFSYKSFYSTPGNNQTIPNNLINKIYVDRDGLLWVGTGDGLAIIKNDGQVIKIVNAATHPLFSRESNFVNDIQEAKNIFWISTRDGLFAVRKQKDQVFTVQIHDLKKEFGYTTNVLGAFTIDSGGQLWICTFNGLVIYNPEKNMLLHTGNNPSSLQILNENKAFRSLYIDESKGQVRYSTWEPAEKIYDLHANKITTLYSGKGSVHPDYGRMINQFLKDDQGTLWIASGKGTRMIRKNSPTEDLIVHKPGNPYGLLSNATAALLQDKEGSVWLASWEGGINITQPYHQPVVNLSLNNVDEYPFAKWPISTIIPVDQNSFLIGTSRGNGLYRTDSSFNVQEHYSFGSMDYDWIWTYYKQGDSIFISTQKGNLIYHTKTKKLDKLLQPPFDQFLPINSFVPGKDSTIWMSRYRNDFMQYDPGTTRYKKYGLAQLGETTTVLSLLRDRENKLWIISSLAGILRFDETKEKITERLPLNKENGLLNTHILFTKDLGDEWLIGYVERGISLYNKKTKIFRHFSRSDGLISNSVTDAVQTDPYTVWIASANGISRFNLQTKTFLNYGYDNGILQNSFECITQLPDGRIAAGNTYGLVYFYPEKMNAAQRIAPPVITAINVYGDNFPIDSFSNNKPLHIANDKNYFSFDYISLQYQNNQPIEYAYKLDGFDKDWVMAGNRRYVSYSNLQGGTYHFKVKARLPGNAWVESETPFPLQVATPFFKRWWFMPLAALFFIVIVYGMFRYRVQQLLRLEKMRSSISSDLHDEVGASLSSISIFSEMAKQSLRMNGKTEQYLQRIGDRSRDSIEKMSDIIWSINPDNDSLQQMLLRMKTFVNETVDGKDIVVYWHENEMIGSLTLGMAQRKNFYLLFKEALMNAVKYSGATTISVQLSAQNHSLVLKVADNGKGFKMAQIRQGNGLKNIRQRATLLGGTATIQSSPGAGTTVQVQFRY